MNRKVIGSLTAKEGFRNEKEIAKKFNNWKEDKTAQTWLKIMGYDIALLESVEAIHIPLRIKKVMLYCTICIWKKNIQKC